MGYFCSKNIFLQLKHDIQWIYLKFLSTTCLEIHQVPCVIFETLSQFFLFQTLQTFDKSIPSKWKCSDFPLLALKFTKFVTPFFKQKVFSSEFGSLFSVMRDNFSELFYLKLFMLLHHITSKLIISTSKCKFLDLPLLALKFTKFLISFLTPRVSFPSNFAILFSDMRHNFSVLFHLKPYML